MRFARGELECGEWQRATSSDERKDEKSRRQCDDLVWTTGSFRCKVYMNDDRLVRWAHQGSVVVGRRDELGAKAINGV